MREADVGSRSTDTIKFKLSSVAPLEAQAVMTILRVADGASGTSPSAPGTNSAGTALSSGGGGNGPQKGPLVGTNPVVDREEAKVDKMIKSICRGC